MKLENTRKIFEKIFKYQNSLISVQWGPSCSMRADGNTETDRQTDRHVEANSGFSQFFERA